MWLWFKASHFTSSYFQCFSVSTISSYLRPQRQVLLLQLLQLALQRLQLAECCGGGGPPRRQRLPQRRGHAGVGLALLRGAGHHPQQLVLLTELMLHLVNLANGEKVWEGRLVGEAELLNAEICRFLILIERFWFYYYYHYYYSNIKISEHLWNIL